MLLRNTIKTMKNKRNNDLRIKILVACHKLDSAIRQDENYLPIHVGKALNPTKDLGFQGDNTGINISNKNTSYCELTALYWGWKNIKDADIFGLAHYRRYLKVKEKDILKLNNNNTIILPRPEYTPYSNLFHLTEGTTREDVYILLKTLELEYPFYTKSAIDYLYNNNGWVGCNMFLSSKELADSYCEWLFNVLSSVESRIQLSPYSRLKRIFGYLGEVLLPIYCQAHDIKIIYTDFASNSNKSQVLYMIQKLRNKFIFRISKYIKSKDISIPASTLVSFENDGIFQ